MTRAAVATLATAATALGAGSASAATVSVKTGSAQDVSSSAATFRATVLLSALGGNVSWQYGTTKDYGTTTRTVPTSLLGISQDVSLTVAGLAPDTEYHVRAVASSGLTSSTGKDVAFKTGKPGTAPGSGVSDPGEDGSGATGDTSGAPVTGTPGSTPGGSTGSTTTTPPTSSGSSSTAGKGKDDTKPSSSEGSGSGDGVTAVDDDFTDAADDGGATTLPGVATADVTPILGRTFAAATVAGKVTATAPSGAAVDLRAARTVPTGTLIDTRAGTVELKSALDRGGRTQTARFWGGLFEVRQAAGQRGLTELVLRGSDFSSCAAEPARAHTRARTASKATKKKKPGRSLWGSDDHGRFETRGRGSVATVRGTRWLTQDTCDGTRTTVAAGAVAVRDRSRGKTVVVTKGHSYLARTAR
jgi:hypothetical protein